MLATWIRPEDMVQKLIFDLRKARTQAKTLGDIAADRLEDNTSAILYSIDESIEDALIFIRKYHLKEIDTSIKPGD